MIEIGVAGGGSLAMWKAYFGPGTKLVGIDADPSCKVHEAEDVEIFIGSQDDQALIEHVLQKYPCPNIVLDDGSHYMPHMIRSFELLSAISIRVAYTWWRTRTPAIGRPMAVG